MAEASNSSRLLGNSALNGAAFAIGAGLNLVMLPFVVRRLGVAAFGVAGLVTACIAPALIFSNALSLSTSRELAVNLSIDRREDARRVLASALLLAAAIGGGIFIVLALAGPPFARLAFHLSIEGHELIWAFAFGAAGWFCQCLSAVLLSVFVARQDYLRVSSINVLGTIVTTLAMLLLIPRWPIASTFLACQAVGFLATLVLAFAWAMRRLGGWLAVPGLHGAAVGRLVRFGVWQLIAQGSGLVAGQADRFLLGVLLSPQFVGLYVIAQRLEEAIYIGILKVGEILFPFFSVLQKESAERRIELFFRSSWILNLLAASALGGLVPVAGPLLGFWTGPEVARQAQRLLIVLSIAGILGCGANVLAFYLLANGRSRYNAVIALVTAVFTLATSTAVLPYFGWWAAGWSACVGMTAQILTGCWLLARTFDHDQLRSRVLNLVVAPLLTGIVTALLLRQIADQAILSLSSTWFNVGLLYGLASAIIFVAIVAMSQLGPYGGVCRRDLISIASRLSPVRTR